MVAALVVIAEVLSACDESDHGPTPAAIENPQPDVVVVPDVLHTDLQAAYRRLEKASFKVSVRSLGRGYRSYATEDPSAKLHMGIDPAPYVADMEPRPGVEVDRGSVVEILDTECPNRMSVCL
jgi:hypothetical protein